MRYSFFLLTSITCILLTSCYSKEQLKEEIRKEIKKETRNYHIAMGDGSIFYAEPICIGNDYYYKHHSILKCPSINNGVLRGWHKTIETNNLFCNTCMDDELITTFLERVFPKKNEEKKKRMIEL